VAISYWVFSLA